MPRRSRSVSPDDADEPDELDELGVLVPLDELGNRVPRVAVENVQLARTSNRAIERIAARIVQRTCRDPSAQDHEVAACPGNVA